MNKIDSHPEGKIHWPGGEEKTPLSDAQALLLEHLGSSSQFGIDALYAKFKEKGLISADVPQKL